MSETMRRAKSKWEADTIKDAILLQDKASEILSGKTVEVIVGLKRFKAKFGDDGMLQIEEKGGDE